MYWTTFHDSSVPNSHSIPEVDDDKKTVVDEIGSELINFLVKSNLLYTDETGTVIIWAAGAPEQLGQRVIDLMDELGGECQRTDTE